LLVHHFFISKLKFKCLKHDCSDITVQRAGEWYRE
jgi:hypothetical protein